MSRDRGGSSKRSDGPTKSQVNKAGRTIRQFVRQDDPTSDELLARLSAAVDVVQAHRAAHQYSLSKATMGLRSVVRTERCELEISQRLKRLPTIMNKLFREPTLQLGNMQDIAGCRAVLGNIDELRRVQRRLQKNRGVGDNGISDYIVSRRDSGYRGVHVIVEYDARRVEVQLRTRMMHEWAITVERLSGRLGVDLKSGLGPPEVLELLRVISEAMAVEEAGGVVDTGLVSEISRLRTQAAPSLEGAS